MKILSALVLLWALQPTVADVILSQKIMDLTKISAELSALAYKENPRGDAYESFGFFDAEPDQALVAKKNGYCFAAFRGTTQTWNDWSQNLRLGHEDICDGTTAECCSTREGFFDAYNTQYKDEMEDALRECAKSCSNKDECVVLSGHSQGGAIAAVAGIYLSDLNPYVITFGQPPTIDAPCPIIASERWYRYVNTKSTDLLSLGIVYDPVPFAPGLGADFFGHMILLSDDNTGVAYIGLDAQNFFGPLDVAGIEAHNMRADTGSPYPGYLDRIEAIIKKAKGSFPIRTSGYIAGSLCTENSECESQQCVKETDFSWSRCMGVDCKADKDCYSNRCDSGVCVSKLGSCQVCDEHSDCESGICTWRFRCTRMDGLMDDECSCFRDADCASGRCEGITDAICEAKLGLGASCNEHSDCISGRCSWGFVCSEGWWRNMEISEANLVMEGKSHTMNTTMEEEETTSTEQDEAASTEEDESAAENQESAVEEEEPISSSTEEQSSKKGKTGTSLNWGRIFTIVVLAILGFFGVRWYNSRRRGYEEIQTELSV